METCANIKNSQNDLTCQNRNEISERFAVKIKCFFCILLGIHFNGFVHQCGCFIIIFFRRCVFQVQKIMREKFVVRYPIGRIMLQQSHKQVLTRCRNMSRLRHLRSIILTLMSDSRLHLTRINVHIIYTSLNRTR